MSNIVKYLYIRDYRSNRVMTVARVVNDTKTMVKVGFAVSRPASYTEWGDTAAPGDQFCKAKGRDIANGRLLKKPIEFPIDGDEKPIITSVRALAKNDSAPRIVRKLAEEWLAYTEWENENCCCQECKPDANL